MTQEILQQARLLATPKSELNTLMQQAVGARHYGVEELLSRPRRFSFSLSPCGAYLSFREHQEDGKDNVFVQELASGNTWCALQEGEEPIKGYGWLNRERLFYLSDRGGDENYWLYACDIYGGDALCLTPYEGCKVQILAILREDPQHIIVGINKNNPQLFEPYKLNIYTAQLEQLYENSNPQAPIQEFLFDKYAVLRGFVRLEGGVNQAFYYQEQEGGEYTHKITTRWDESFDILCFNYPSNNRHEAYVASNIGRDKTAILLYDLRTMKPIKELFVNEDYDVAHLSLSRKRNYEINYWAYDADKYTIVPLSDTYKKIDRKMKQECPEELYYVVDYDDEEETFLVVAQSDREYGTYYTYCTATDELQLLCSLKPHLKKEYLAPMLPIELTAADGLPLRGYLTLPIRDDETTKVPLVLIPHGGPQGIRDTWGFDHEAQLLAQYGYATLQVNFRISGGYGKAFLQAGFKQIGNAVQADMEDAVDYVVGHYPIDAKRMAVYGGSHGGYATLMALVRNPDKFVCGIDYVGISSIETFFESFPEYWKPMRDVMKEIWYDVDDPKELQQARDVSPLLQIDRIQKPVFVVQGANDPRVKLSEANQMVQALRHKGLFTPYMVKENEGHGFYHEENRIEFYKAMIGFLKSYL